MYYWATVSCQALVFERLQKRLRNFRYRDEKLLHDLGYIETSGGRENKIERGSQRKRRGEVADRETDRGCLRRSQIARKIGGGGGGRKFRKE